MTAAERQREHRQIAELATSATTTWACFFSPTADCGLEELVPPAQRDACLAEVERDAAVWASLRRSRALSRVVSRQRNPRYKHRAKATPDDPHVRETLELAAGCPQSLRGHFASRHHLQP